MYFVKAMINTLIKISLVELEERSLDLVFSLTCLKVLESDGHNPDGATQKIS